MAIGDDIVKAVKGALTPLNSSLSEDARQNATDDNKFYKSMFYLFELQIPSGQGGLSSFVIPMVLNPQDYTLEEPYAITSKHTLGGGLYVEENGIIDRVIRLKGHTGFKPRVLKTEGTPAKNNKVIKSFFRDYPPKGFNKNALSGHKHFQFLQDTLRTYADFKRNPATAKDTRLFFHVLKDDEHWRVAPIDFKLNRTSSRSTIYEYEIELLVFGPALLALEFNASEDKSLLDKIKDPLRMIKSGADLVSGSIRELTAIQEEIRGIVRDIGTTLDSVTNILVAVDEFLEGTKSLINTPRKVIEASFDNFERAIAQLTDATDTGQRTVPDSLINNFRQVQDGLNRISSFPSLIRSDTSKTLELSNNLAEFRTSKSRTALETAAAEDSPTTFEEWGAKGTANMPGDLLRADSELGLARALQNYKSTFEYVVKSGDTMQNLSAKFLGDARLWRYIAFVNNLRFPYIDTTGIPGTADIGDTILIPSKDLPPEEQSIVPVLGVSPELSPEVKILGTDLRLEKAYGEDFWDIPIDPSSGNTDIKYVEGIDNLKQALIQRLETEKGTDVLYQNLGVDRIIGISLPDVDNEILKLRIKQAIEADPRIHSVSDMNIDFPSDDAVVVDIQAEIIGLTESNPLKLEVL